jgi:hypothetical protein
MRKIIQGESINMPNKTVGYLADTFSAGSKAVIHSSAFALKADSEDDTPRALKRGKPMMSYASVKRQASQKQSPNQMSTSSPLSAETLTHFT